MSKRTKDQLKAAFSSGKKPSATDFQDLIDSLLHVDQQTAVDAQVVTTQVSTFATGLNARNPDGIVNSLGDVYNVFRNYSDARSVAQELSWSGLPGKPGTVNLSWTEQTLVTDSTVYNPSASAGSAGAGAAQRWLLSGVGALTGSYLIVDLKTERHFVAGTGGEGGNFYDSVIGVKIAITPKTSLT